MDLAGKHYRQNYQYGYTADVYQYLHCCQEVGTESNIDSRNSQQAQDKGKRRVKDIFKEYHAEGGYHTEHGQYPEGNIYSH